MKVYDASNDLIIKAYTCFLFSNWYDIGEREREICVVEYTTQKGVCDLFLTLLCTLHLHILRGTSCVFSIHARFWTTMIRAENDSLKL